MVSIVFEGRVDIAPVRLKCGSIDKSGSSMRSFSVPCCARVCAFRGQTSSDFLSMQRNFVGAPLLLGLATSMRKRFL